MARRVIQFPVRNAFAAQRSHDALARDERAQTTQDHAHRIASQVESEIARLAERQATGNRAAFESVRSRDVIVLHPPTRIARLRKHIVATSVAVRAFASKLFTRS